MKMKGMSSLFCAVAFFGTTSVAMAGAYGEAEQAEEMPRSAPAAAEVIETEEFSPFPYLAVGAVYSEEFFDGNVRTLHNTYGWGVNARAGYRFHPNVAAELLYENVIEFDADRGTDRGAWTLMPNLKIFLMEGFCEPYLSVGGGLMKSDNDRGITRQEAKDRSDGTFPRPGGYSKVDDGYGFAGRFGAGADFYATENIFIEAEVAYVLPVTSNVEDYDHLNFSLGIGYAFN